jgi:hypothetical protein
MLSNNDVKFKLFSLILEYFKIQNWNIGVQNLGSYHNYISNFYIKVRINLQTVDRRRSNGARVWTSFGVDTRCQ